MRKKRDAGSGEHRSDRLGKNAQHQIDQGCAEENALDAAVRRSIKEFGA